MKFIVGLTGGIGSGKSAASQWFEQQGIDVVDADIVARQIVAPEHPTLQQIKHEFGDWVLLDNGELNRSALREHIFKYPEARKALENITHPAIRHAIIQQLQDSQSPYTILVSPLLFETNQHQLTQHNLLIDASEEMQRLRASQRDGQSPEQIEKIIQAQMPRLEKQKRAQDIVLNHGSIDDLYQKLRPLHQQYLSQAQNIKL